MKFFFALAGFALATFALVWTYSQSDRGIVGPGLVQESGSSKALGPDESSGNLNAVAGGQRSRLQPEMARAEEWNEVGLEGAEWCSGEVVLPEGGRLYPGSEVIGRGGLWADGTEERRAQVAPDGSFRVAFAPGTYRGTVKLVARGLSGKTNGIWRPWHLEPLYLFPHASSRFALRVVDEGPDPKGEIRVQKVARRGFLKTLAQAVFVDGQGAGRFDAFGDENSGSLYLVSAPGRAALLVEPKLGTKGEAETTEVPLHAPARLAGSVICLGEGQPRGLWLGCDQPFRIAADSDAGLQMGLALTDGSFDVQVPAGVELILRAGASGHAQAVMTIAALSPGESRDHVLLEPVRKPGLKGRIVDGSGQPIVGAHIRGLTEFYSGGASHLDPGMGPMQRAVSGAGGEFELLGLGGYLDVPLEVVVPLHADSQSFAQGDWDEAQPSQHYVHVPVSSGEQTLVYAPGANGLIVKVVDHLAQPVEEYCVRLKPQRHVGKLARSLVWRRSVRPVSSALYQQEHPWESPGDWRAYSVERRYTVDNEEGTFDCSFLPIGTWKLRIDAQGYSPTETMDVSLPRTEPLVIRLPKPASLTVRLIDDAGDPWESQRLVLLRFLPEDVWNVDPLFSLPAGEEVSGTDGVVRFTNQAPGSYGVRALGAHRPLLKAQSVELVEGEQKSVTFQMTAFGSAKVELSGAGTDLTVSSKVQVAGTNKPTGHSSDRGRGLFYPELELANYEMIFGAVGILNASEPLIPNTPFRIRRRTITEVPVSIDPSVCYLEGSVLINGQPVGTGRLHFLSQDRTKTVVNVHVDGDGFFHAYFSRSGMYRATYTARRKGLLSSSVLVGVPPGKTQGAEIRVQTCALVLSMRVKDGVDPVFLGLPPSSIWLRGRSRDGSTPRKIAGVWEEGEAVFDFVPAGTYLVQHGLRGGPGEWRVIPGQTVVVPSDMENLHSEVLAEPLTTLAGVCSFDWDGPPVTANLRVWADPELKVLVREQAYPVAERVPFFIRGVTIGKVWVTVGRDFLRPKTPGPGDPKPKRPVFGPFLVPEDGLVGVDILVGPLR